MNWLRGIALAPLLVCGCISDPTWGWASKKHDSDSRSSVRTRADRLEAMRQLAKTLPSASVERQQEVSVDLGTAIRTEGDPLLRAQMLRTLAQCQTETAGIVIRAGLGDRDAGVRIAACEATAARGGADSVTSLGELLASDTDLDVRLAAARALGEIEDPSVVPALAVALEDPNPALQYRAVKSLEKSTGQDFGNDVEAWRTFAQGGTPDIKTPTLAERLRRVF
jgi:HEAT repeat protein